VLALHRSHRASTRFNRSVSSVKRKVLSVKSLLCKVTRQGLEASTNLSLFSLPFEGDRMLDSCLVRSKSVLLKLKKPEASVS
jgi:hypothetical protein